MWEFIMNLTGFAWVLIGFFLFGVLIIILGFCEARVPEEAYRNESHHLHKKAQKIYGYTYDLWGLPSKGENHGLGCVIFGLLWCLLFGSLIYLLWNNGTLTTFEYTYLHLRPGS